MEFCNIFCFQFKKYIDSKYLLSKLLLKLAGKRHCGYFGANLTSKNGWRYGRRHHSSKDLL
jgi:hypothetical protein